MLPTRLRNIQIAAGSLLIHVICAAVALSAPNSGVMVNDYTAGSSQHPTTVNVGVWIMDVGEINSAAQSFSASMFVRLRWNDPSLVHDEAEVKLLKLSEVWSPEVQIVNENGRVRRTLPETVKVRQDGTVTYRQRYVGQFSQKLNLHDFPFDTQLFRLHMITVQEDREVVFTPDDELIAEGIDQAAGIAKEISLPDWAILDYTAGPMPYEITADISESGYAFSFIAKRHSEYYLLKVIMPLVLIVLMSWTVFWINPKEAGIQISVATASMLTLIAYRFTIDLVVPKVPYLTRLDAFILWSTFLVFLSLVQAILTSSLMRLGQDRLALRIDQFCRVLFPICFSSVVVVSFLL